MEHPQAIVIGGVDCHLDQHHAVALDTHGQRLGDQAFPATRQGYQHLLTWLQHYGQVQAVGVESTGSYVALV